MQLEIKITGYGTAEQIADALKSLFSNLAYGDHISGIEDWGKVEWEDPTLFTTIVEYHE